MLGYYLLAILSSVYILGCNGATLGQACNETDVCTGTYQVCNTICVCDTGYYDSTGTSDIGGTCVQNKANGKDCLGTTIDDCSDPYSECENGKCTCRSYYYDNNGLAVGGKCQPVSELQVGSIVFHNIQTTSFDVLWTHPSDNLLQFVNYYEVRWWEMFNETTDNESLLILVPPKSTYTVTDITPGKTYMVEIRSHNTQTDSNNERTASFSKEQAAKPNKVQKITSSGDDLDVETSGLTIRYTPGTGGRSGFNVRLFDGDTKIAEKDPGQVNTSITVYNSNLPNNYGNLKNGYNYTVKIKTKSESYDSGNIVESDVFEAIMKTTPKQPNPPENGQCDNVLDNAITVTWNPPAVPNGYIIRYHVQVYQSSSSVYTTRSTVNDINSLKIDGLDPGTSYNFLLITQNEVGNSSTSSWISSGCKTKARMAEAPQNLQISNTSSRGFTVTWHIPVNLYSEENFGYDLQIKNDTDTCVTRVLYQCSNCYLGLFKFSALTNPCTGVSQATEMKTKDQLLQPFSYTAVLKPATLYTVTVSAINGAGQGYIAEASNTTLEEVPPNHVEQSHDIIYYQHDVKQTSFSVYLYKEFFQQNEHGMIRATGLIGCIADKCNFNDTMSLSEFNSITSWTISSNNGYTTYRITKHDWLEIVTRKKRQISVNAIKFAIGVDECVNIPEGVYCNGPLAPGSSYTIVAVACTNGGCLLSKSYGPFKTLKELSCDSEATSSYMTAIIVLGVIILILLSCIGYLMVKLRRLTNQDQIKKSDVQQQPQYVNRMFLDVVSQ